MAIRLRCPNGHRIVVEDADAGLSVRCGECGVHVRVPASVGAEVPSSAAIRRGQARDPAPPIPAAEDEEQPRRRRRERRLDLGSHPYQRVRIGLALHYTWLLVYLVAFALAILTIISSADARGGLGALVAILSILVWVSMFFAKPILGILGSAFCLRVQSGSGARPYVWTSMALDLASLVAGVLALFLGAFALSRRGPDGAFNVS